MPAGTRHPSPWPRGKLARTPRRSLGRAESKSILFLDNATSNALIDLIRSKSRAVGVTANGSSGRTFKGVEALSGNATPATRKFLRQPPNATLLGYRPSRKVQLSRRLEGSTASLQEAVSGQGSCGSGLPTERKCNDMLAAHIGFQGVKTCNRCDPLSALAHKFVHYPHGPRRAEPFCWLLKRVGLQLLV